MSEPQVPAALLETFSGLDWTPYDVQTWRGSECPDDAPIRAVCCMLYAGHGHLVLARIATRGWDVPGGRVNTGEDIYDGLRRELLEEVGARAFEYSEPELLGWLRICHDEDPFYILYFQADLITRRRLSTEVPEEVLGVGTFPIDALPSETVARAWYPLIK